MFLALASILDVSKDEDDVLLLDDEEDRLPVLSPRDLEADDLAADELDFEGDLPAVRSARPPGLAGGALPLALFDWLPLLVGGPPLLVGGFALALVSPESLDLSPLGGWLIPSSDLRRLLLINFLAVPSGASWGSASSVDRFRGLLLV